MTMRGTGTEVIHDGFGVMLCRSVSVSLPLRSSPCLTCVDDCVR